MTSARFIRSYHHVPNLSHLGLARVLPLTSVAQASAFIVPNLLALRRLKINSSRAGMSDAFKASRRRYSREVHIGSAKGTNTNTIPSCALVSQSVAHENNYEGAYVYAFD